MNFSKRVLAGGAVASMLLAAPAQAANHGSHPDFLQLLQRLSGHYLIMVTRSLIDLTYDSIQAERNSMTISGLTLYPDLEWDQDAACRIEIDKAFTGGTQGFEQLQSVIEFSGVTLSPACLPPDVGGMLGAFGYENLTADTMTIDISYNLPSSAADLTIQAAIRDAGDLTLSAAFDYLWIRFPMDGGDDPIPVAILNSAELAFENTGVWERVEPMVLGQIGDPAAVPPMIKAMMGQMFSEGGTRAPSQAESAFADNVAAQVERFLKEKNRLVISVSPEDGLYLSEDEFQSPAQAIATGSRIALEKSH